MRFNFICHPYHRGGVTSWMKNAFIETQTSIPGSGFLTVLPKKAFLSAGNRPDMVTFLDHSTNVYFKKVGVEFELGTLEYKTSVYRRLISKYASSGDVLIPSDDEACWRACCQLSSKYKVIGILHSDDEPYYKLYHQYKNFLTGVVSVSKRIKLKLAGSQESIAHEVIPCGIPLEDFKISEEKTNSISWIGRIEEEQKRVSDIIKIANQLNQEVQNWEMHVFGDGGPLESLKSEAIVNKLETKLKFHGWTPAHEISTRLSSSKILLQTSNFEGMSVAVMEALASGCIIVSSKVSGVEDLVDDPLAQDLVYLYATGNIEEAKKKIIHALSDDYPDRPKRARELAEKHFGIASCLRAYQQFGNSLQVRNEAFPKPISSKVNNILSHPLAWLRYLKFKIIQ